MGTSPRMKSVQMGELSWSLHGGVGKLSYGDPPPPSDAAAAIAHKCCEGLCCFLSFAKMDMISCLTKKITWSL